MKKSGTQTLTDRYWDQYFSISNSLDPHCETAFYEPCKAVSDCYTNYWGWDTGDFLEISYVYSYSIGSANSYTVDTSAAISNQMVYLPYMTTHEYWIFNKITLSVPSGAAVKTLSISVSC